MYALKKKSLPILIFYLLFVAMKAIGSVSNRGNNNLKLVIYQPWETHKSIDHKI